MKRLIALIISIAMIASLATGLAVTEFAVGGEGPSVDVYFDGEGNDCFFVCSEKKGYSVSSNYSDTNYFSATTDTDGSITLKVEENVVVDHIEATGDLKIDLNGKTLTVSKTDEGSDFDTISVADGNLTITGGGILELYAKGDSVTYCLSTYSGNITIDGTTISATSISTYAHGIYACGGDIIIKNNSAVTIWATGCAIKDEDCNIEISSGSVITATVETAEGIYAISGNIEISGDSDVTVTACTYGIYAEAEISINNSNIDITAVGEDSIGIFACNNLEIQNNSSVKVTGCYPIWAGSDVVIDDSEVIVDATGSNSMGITSDFSTIDINSTSKEIKARGTYAFVARNGINVNGATITYTNVGEYFNNAAEYEYIELETESYYYVITGTDWVSLKTSSALEDLEDIEEENDPEVEIDLGNGPVTLKTSNNSVVFNEKKYFEASIGDGNLFVPIDLSSAPKKIDGLFFNNEVYKYIDDFGKDIELINRFAKAEIYTNKEVGNNPLSLHLSEVSEIPGTCATAIQKNAMETSKVYAQVNYSFVSNGKPVENDAKIYVPVTGNAKVFYLFSPYKIGIVPCEVKDGYCIFDRYFDGTYVVVAK